MTDDDRSQPPPNVYEQVAVLRRSVTLLTAELARAVAERDEAQAQASLELDWERLRAGEVRALNPGYQDVFDAYAQLRAERDEARAEVNRCKLDMRSMNGERDRLRALLRDVVKEVRDCHNCFARSANTALYAEVMAALEGRDDS